MEDFPPKCGQKRCVKMVVPNLSVLPKYIKHRITMIKIINNTVFVCYNTETIKKGGNYMKLSARNQLKGKVVSIEKGAVNGIVRIELKGGDVITSTISMGAIEELGLEVGKEAYAVIKATSVMVGVDHHHKC